jgi:hypothetical protein
MVIFFQRKSLRLRAQTNIQWMVAERLDGGDVRILYASLLFNTVLAIVAYLSPLRRHHHS